MLIFVQCHFTPTWCSTVPVWTFKNLKELLVPAPYLHEHLLSLLLLWKHNWVLFSDVTLLGVKVVLFPVILQDFRLKLSC